MLQCCRAFSMSARREELFFDMNYYEEIFNFAINIKCVLLISIVYIYINLLCKMLSEVVF